MSLRASMQIRRGGFDLDLDLHVAEGETVSLLGPNGAGKSTVVHALAGLLPLSGGEVILGDRLLESPAKGVRLSPQLRCVGVLFQDLHLFPSLTVRENVGFGLRARGISSHEARRCADGWLERFDLAGHGGKRPDQLSGGEAQRVALARALAVEPQMLLLDEPLSSLDVETKASASRLLREVIEDYRGVKLLITHDPVEALSLAGKVVIIERGRLVQQGTPDEVARRPRSPYVASLVGVNLFRGLVGRREGHAVVRVGDAALQIAETEIEGEVIATVHPRAVVISLEESRISARNTLRGAVESIDVQGDRARVRIGSSPPLIAEITTGAVADLVLREGMEVWATLKATEIEVYPR